MLKIHDQEQRVKESTKDFDPLSKQYVGWPKHAIRALRNDDVSDLISCFEPLNFLGKREKNVNLCIGRQVESGILGHGPLHYCHVYDVGFLKMEVSDTLLDIAHRNRKVRVRASIRSFGGKVANLTDVEEEELKSIEKAKLKKKMEEDGRL